MKKVKMCRISFIGAYILTGFLLSLIFIYDWLFGMSFVWKIVLALLSLLIALEPEFKRLITTYIFETDRIIEETGLLAKKRVEVSYGNVSQIM
ncbi:MAG TPA: hypothetical protein ENG45_00925, partial [Candidatus Aenigmarchaeota archaeon]|nr:hypothetical protein [Candidatus Aenigmarchaeota archaeon]